MEQEYKRSRDDSRELTLMLEKKNQDLLEKQDTEVYLATLKERNRIARETMTMWDICCRGLS